MRRENLSHLNTRWEILLLLALDKGRLRSLPHKYRRLHLETSLGLGLRRLIHTRHNMNLLISILTQKIERLLLILILFSLDCKFGREYLVLLRLLLNRFYDHLLAQGLIWSFIII